jgi:hypothetical protein
MDDLKTLLSSIESYGGGGNFKGKVYIESEKYDALPEEIRNDISYDASRWIQRISETIKMEWAKENEADLRRAHVAELSELFKSAGFDPIYVEVIGNEYCSEACCYKYPWIIVTTNKGRIKLGWRKRVMNLDWSDLDIEVDGQDLFKGEKTTTGKDYVHCWSKEKAIEYLRKLNSDV